MSKLLLVFCCCSFLLRAQLYKDPSQPIEARVADLLQRMSPAEKAWQLFMVPSDFHTTKCRFSDGIFGIQLFATGLADPNQQLLNYSSTNSNLEIIARANDIQKYFMENTRLGNPELVQRAAGQIALEARLIGIRQVLSPVLNLATGRGDDYITGSGEPLHPFSYGLSYTPFAYSQLKIEQNTYSLTSGNDTIELSFLLQNTGQFDGAEAIQFYVKPIYSSETLPVQYLIDTKKIQLKKGETMGFVSYKIPLVKLGIPTGPGSDAYPMQFQIQIGSSSKDIRLQSPILEIQF